MGINPVLQTGLLNQSSAQVIDGSLNFEGGKNQALIRTPTAVGNRKTWTWSCWLKKQNDNRSTFFSAGTTSSDTGFSEFGLGTQKRLRFSGWNTNWKTGSERLRDYNNFYHFVIAVDYTNSTASNKVRLYKNGVEVTDLNSNNTPSDTDRAINDTVIHYIGGIDGGGGENLTFTDYQMSQVYFIDGLQLGPEKFGFTDPLTNTWRPKKFRAEGTTVNDGTVWSGGISGNTLSGYPATNAFNGNVSSFVYANVNTTMTWTAPKRITGQKIEVYAYAGGNWPILEVNGQSTGAVVGGTTQHNVWVDVTDLCGGPGGVLETITAYGQNIGGVDRQSGFSAVAVDGVTMVDSTTQNLDFGTNGFYLPFDGNSPIGQDKSGVVTPNNGSIWSNSLTSSSGFRSSEPKTNAFDGNTSSICSAVGSGTITFTSPVTFASNSTIRVFLHGGDHTVTVNGGSNQTISAGSYQTVTYSNSGNATFTMTFHRGGGADTGVRAIEIDNHILVDGQIGNNWTPVNFGGSAGVDQATGALPILEGAGGTVANVGVRTDAYSSYLTLALPLVGSANDVSNQINSGSTAKTVSVNGDPASSTLQSNFYGASFYFDGNSESDYVSVADNDQLDVGSGDFTIECWAYTSGWPLTNNTGLLSKRGGNGAAHWQLVLNRNGQIQFGDQSTWSNYFGTASGTTGDQIFKNAWHHIAITRTGGSVQAWYDGRKYGTAITNTTDFSTSANFSVGVGREGLYDPFNGYVNDVRVYKGVAKYTDSFVPASTNPTILPDSPSGVSGGSKLNKITDGAVHFDGNGDYLEVKSATDFAFGTGDFTLEAYIYATSLPNTNNRIFCSGAGGAGNRTNFQLMVGSAGYLEFAHTTNYQTANGLIGTNRWYHVAATREGTSLKMFIDGVLQHTGTSSVDVTENGGVTIGREFGYTSYFNGFISNARILKGTALYTSNFTPPARTLTNVTNTKLLCCQSTTQAGDAAVSPSLGGINDGTIWSSFLSCAGGFSSSAPAVNAFNGDNTNKANNAGNSGYALTNSFDNALIFAPSTPLTNVTKIEILTRNPSSTTAGIVNLDTGSGFGSNIVTGTGWTTVYDSTAVTLNRIRIVNTYHGEDELAGIKINDTLLLDPISVYGDAPATTFNPFNTDIKTVRGQESGYCTLSPLHQKNATITENNLQAQVDSDGTNYVVGTIAVDSGQWYWEFTTVGSNNMMLGAAKVDASDYNISSTGNVFYYYGNGGNIWPPNSSYGSTLSVGDTLGVALDMDAGTLTYYKNGMSLGVAFNSGLSGETIVPSIGTGGGSGSITRCNFGQKPFKFPPPDGFQPLNAANVRPETVITRPDQYVGVTTYTGDSNPIPLKTGFSPDLVFIKSRTSSTTTVVFDSVRGLNNYLQASETDQSYSGGITQTFVDGYLVPTGGASNNGSSNTYVTWTWKAGGNKGTFNIDGEGRANASDVSMSEGSLNSSSYNTSQRWSGNLSVNTGSISNAAQAFNANLTNGADSSASTGSDDRRMTATIGLTLNNETVEVYPNHTYSGYYATIDGVKQPTQYFTTPNGFKTMGPFTGTLTSVTVTNGTESSNRPAGIRAIKVGGKILVDDNITPPNVPSITNTGCSVGTKQGFSITKFTTGSGTSGGATIAHGLNSKPSMYMYKPISTSGEWVVVHSANYKRFAYLNATTEFRTISGQGGGTAADPTDKVLSIYDLGVALASKEYICYAWSDVPGMQRFGRYEGSGVAGNYVHLGFRPALLWIKSFDSTSIQNWGIIDSTRSYANPGNHTLATNLTNPESYFGDGSSVYGSSNKIDLVSDGFVLRESSGFGNTSGITFIYCAWAERPAFNLYGAQSNAR